MQSEIMPETQLQIPLQWCFAVHADTFGLVFFFSAAQLCDALTQCHPSDALLRLGLAP